MLRLSEFHFQNLPIEPVKGKKRKLRYLSSIIALDIETTTISPTLSFIYEISICIDGEIVILRRPSELVEWLEQLRNGNLLSDDKRAIIWVHNLSYEFQFLKHYIKPDKVLALKNRSILKAECNGIEFRCSYLLTDMSLKKWAENIKECPIRKLELDYKQIRYPWTMLSDKEIEYCKNDVLIQYYGIKEKLDNGESFYTMPLTATGYIRQHFRNICKRSKEWQSYYRAQKLDVERYIYYRDAFAGGQVHMNPAFFDRIVEADSFDKSSDYPFQLIYRKYPMTVGSFIYNPQPELLFEMMDRDDLFLIDIELTNVRQNFLSYAYIQASSCIVYDGEALDNGRIFKADYLRIRTTSEDIKSIFDFYDFNIYSIKSILYHKKISYLPQVFRYEVLKMYKEKTELKGVDDFLYNHKKRRFNAVYGMTVTAPVRDEIKYNVDTCQISEHRVRNFSEKEFSNALTQFYESQNNFLPYTIGVWVTAYARRELAEAIKEVGLSHIYNDTDCVKCIHGQCSDYFKAQNQKIYAELKRLYGDVNLFAPRDKYGVRHVIGFWENETRGNKYYFRGFGSKRYVTEIDGKTKITIAGCSPTESVKYLNQIGDRPIEAIHEGLEIPPPYSGRTSSSYIEYPQTYIAEGEEIVVPSCLVITDVPYTLGDTKEFDDYKKFALTIREEWGLEMIRKEAQYAANRRKKTT